LLRFTASMALQFKLARFVRRRPNVVVEAYGHNGKTSIKFLPYEQIKLSSFMEESEEGRGRHTIKALPTSVTYDEDFLGHSTEVWRLLCSLSTIGRMSNFTAATVRY